jgi:hypothetical protein
MQHSDLTIAGWHELDRHVRRLSEAWASAVAERCRRFDDDDPRRGYEGYTALAAAARTSAAAFVAQWARTIGTVATAAYISEQLKEESVHFRTAASLVKHAMRATQIELRHHSGALRRARDEHEYEDRTLGRVPWSQQRLVIDHAVYALYIAWQPGSKILVPDNRAALLKAMALDESLVRVISPRQFEEVIAYLYECLGCEVELTPATRDFGADILAWHGGPLQSESLIAIQVKRYAEQRRVGIKSLFELHGAVAHYGADSGHIITSSDFTQPARVFAKAQRLHLVNLRMFQAELARLFRS